MAHDSLIFFVLRPVCCFCKPFLLTALGSPSILWKLEVVLLVLNMGKDSKIKNKAKPSKSADAKDSAKGKSREGEAKADKKVKPVAAAPPTRLLQKTKQAEVERAAAKKDDRKKKSLPADDASNATPPSKILRTSSPSSSTQRGVMAIMELKVAASEAGMSVEEYLQKNDDSRPKLRPKDW